jgi:hypothetical protein
MAENGDDPFAPFPLFFFYALLDPTSLFSHLKSGSNEMQISKGKLKIS